MLSNAIDNQHEHNEDESLYANDTNFKIIIIIIIIIIDKLV